MKKTFIYTAVLIAASALGSCTGVFDITPRDRVSANDLLATPEGIEAYMANLYGRLPIEDFSYCPEKGFSLGIGNTNPNNGGRTQAMYTDEAVHSEYSEMKTEDFNFWEGYIDGDGVYKNYRKIYTLISDINNLIEVIPTLTSADEGTKTALEGEAAFLRAFTYYALVKRYGGVPVIKKVQEYSENPDDLKVPRSKEKDCWDFILEDCDTAIDNLGESTGTRRANRWIALALKSRAALHAASIAKFTHEPYVSLSGPAVQQELVGIAAEEADGYYEQCMDACEEIMSSGLYGLYIPAPESKEEAIAGLVKMFMNPNDVLADVQEPMFIKGYTSGSELANNFDIWHRPNQLANSWPHPGRMNPVMELIDAYEDYTDNGLGLSAPVWTYDGENAAAEPSNDFDKNVDYYSFPVDEPYKMFDNKDVRLHATMILPGTEYKNTKIIIQGGFVRPDGTHVFRTNSSVKIGETTYYAFGASASSLYSGFDQTGGNYTRSGFLMRKFMQEDHNVTGAWNNGDADWIEFRYGEILLNYAEAAAECSTTTAEQLAAAKKALNDVRHRACHTDNIDLTVNNVRKERLVELAFENKRKWDLVRWRTYHTEFENRYKTALVPFLDLRGVDTGGAPSYIFVRMTVPGTNPQTFNYLSYYKQIPGTGSNGLVQNP